MIAAKDVLATLINHRSKFSMVIDACTRYVIDWSSIHKNQIDDNDRTYTLSRRLRGLNRFSSFLYTHHLRLE